MRGRASHQIESDKASPESSQRGIKIGHVGGNVVNETTSPVHPRVRHGACTSSPTPFLSFFFLICYRFLIPISIGDSAEGYSNYREPEILTCSAFARWLKPRRDGTPSCASLMDGWLCEMCAASSNTATRHSQKKKSNGIKVGFLSRVITS